MAAEIRDSHFQDIVNPNRGYFLIRGFLNPSQVNKYREECEQFLLKGERIYKRVSTKNIPDYVHPRTVLPNGKLRKNEEMYQDSSTYRIYQFLHNTHSPETEEIFHKALSLRNQIEERWIHNAAYKKKRENLEDYILATKYVQNSHGLPKHSDFKGELPYPLLQCLILLSQPDKDYQGGDFILYSKMDNAIKIQSDLNIEKGDALFFDKSLFHEVEPTRGNNKSNIGRWTVIIGARQPKSPNISQRIKELILRPVHRIERYLT